jgi:hypothetical protein
MRFTSIEYSDWDPLLSDDIGKGSQAFTRVVELLLRDEHIEFLRCFPRYSSAILALEKRYRAFKAVLTTSLEKASDVRSRCTSRRDFATWAYTEIEPVMLFAFYDNRISTVQEYLNLLGAAKIVEKI